MLKKILILYKKKVLIISVLNYFKPYFFGALIFFSFKKNNRIKIHLPKANQIDSSDTIFAKRLFISYKKMKKDQISKEKIFLPSKMWQNHIDKDFYYLKDSVDKNDIDKFLFFISNFGNWDTYLGIEDNVTLKRYTKNVFSRRYYENKISKMLDVWECFKSKEKSISDLSQPHWGNQLGAYIDSQPITIGSFFNEIISSNLNVLIEKINHPIIADLGGGYGKLAYYILKNKKKFSFIDFDLPETLCLAAYYLNKCFPNKKILLYGEEDFSNEMFKEYDLIFMPNYEIEKLSNDSIDLLVNKNSLGEMQPDQVKVYLKHINRATRFFFHMNHEKIKNKFDNHSSSLIADEYPISTEKFELLYKYPDFSSLIYKGVVDLNDDIYMRLYKKI